jgi:hypothetical protein
MLNDEFGWTIANPPDTIQITHQPTLAKTIQRTYGRIACSHRFPQWPQSVQASAAQLMERDLRECPSLRILLGCWLGQHLAICRLTVDRQSVMIWKNRASPSVRVVRPRYVHSDLTSLALQHIQRTWWGRAKLNLIWTMLAEITKSVDRYRPYPTQLRHILCAGKGPW